MKHGVGYSNINICEPKTFPKWWSAHPTKFLRSVISGLKFRREKSCDGRTGRKRKRQENSKKDRKTHEWNVLNLLHVPLLHQK